MNMVDTPIGTTTTVPVKSKFGSKTNITGALIAIFGLLGVFDILPGDLDTTATAGAVVTAGGVLVTFFRTIARSVLR
jgi:hypothetical protein